MKTRNQKAMIGLTAAASLLCAVNIAWILLQSWYVSIGSGDGCIIWHEELYPMQITLFAGRLVFKTLFYALMIVFLAKQTKAIKNGTLFPRKNITVLSAITASYFLGSLCNANFSECLLTGTGQMNFVIDIDMLLYTTMLIVFTIVYRIAVGVSEENNLTI